MIGILINQVVRIKLRKMAKIPQRTKNILGIRARTYLTQDQGVFFFNEST